MPNVEVLSLSVNRIRTLSDFRHCLKLSELYLRKNEVQLRSILSRADAVGKIADLQEIRQLQHLKNLSVLWLCDNPCVGDSPATYRAQTIAILPNISKLDNIDVTEEERREAAEAYKNLSQNTSEDDGICFSSREKFATEPAHDCRGASHVEASNDAIHSRSQNNILFAVLALLKELDRDALRTVESEVLHRLRNEESSRKN
eukprot:753948-Hanusia_phi.AAC.5